MIKIINLSVYLFSIGFTKNIPKTIIFLNLILLALLIFFIFKYLFRFLKNRYKKNNKKDIKKEIKTFSNGLILHSRFQKNFDLKQNEQVNLKFIIEMFLKEPFNENHFNLNDLIEIEEPSYINFSQNIILSEENQKITINLYFKNVKDSETIFATIISPISYTLSGDGEYEVKEKE